MATVKRFEKLLEPFQIGSVKTRNRIVKTGAGMFMWHEDELNMNEAIKAFYDRLLERGKPKKVALCACARKLLHVAWAVAHSQQMFDPDYHKQALVAWAA